MVQRPESADEFTPRLTARDGTGHKLPPTMVIRATSSDPDQRIARRRRAAQRSRDRVPYDDAS